MPADPPFPSAAGPERLVRNQRSVLPAIPDHTLLRRIGAGSYGEVWLARNILDTHRAVKIVWRETFDSDRPYDREFTGIQKFEPVSRSHAGLVDILQIGRNNTDGYFYYVMELADDAGAEDRESDTAGPGADLPFVPDHYRPRTLRSEIDRRGRIPFDECLGFLMTITAGLAALHRHGLIHRDIKPSNIIIVDGEAKLADIGLVAEASEGRSFVGTEGFIAPEGPGSVQSDIYSLGKVLYEAATGNDRLSFPSLPSSPDNGKIDNALLELNTVMLRACATDPQDRYPSASELHGDLLLLRSGRSVKRIRLLESRLKFARQAGAVAGILALLAVAAFLVVGYRERLARETSDRLQRALDRANAAEGESERRLYDSLAATARAECRSGVVGQRFAALAAVVNAARLRPGAPELRDAAITALATPDFKERRRIPVPTGCQAACFSGDLDTLFAAFTNGLIRATRTADGGEAFTLTTAPGPMAWMAWPGGSSHWIAACRSSGEMELWDVSKRQLTLKLPRSFNCAVSADDRWLVDLTTQRTITVHDLTSRDVRQVAIDPVFDVLSTGGANCFAVASRSTNLASIIEFATGRPRFTIQTPAVDTIHSIQLSADEETLVVSFRGGHVHIYDLREPTSARATLAPHSSAVYFARFHPDGDWCLTSSWDGTTRILGVNEGRPLAVLRQSIGSPVFSRDGSRAGWVDYDANEMVLLEVRGRETCRVLAEPIPLIDDQPGPWNASFLPDGRLLATACFDGVRLYETEMGRQVAHIPSTNWFAVAFSGVDLLYAGGGHGLSQWRLHWTGTNEFWVDQEEHLLGHFQWHINGNPSSPVVLATGLTNFLLLSPGRPSTSFPFDIFIRGAFLSPAGNRIAATQAGRGLHIWDAATGKVVGRFPAKYAGGSAFDPGESRVAINDLDSVAVWDIKSGQEVWRTKLQGTSGPLAWSPDGRVIAAAREGIISVLLDADSGATLARLEPPDPRPFNAIMFSPDSGKLACASTSHFVLLWDLRALRHGLREIGLDWNQPPLPEARRVHPIDRVRLTSP